MDEADDQFEDFTTASDWEIFVARLEQILTEWMSKPLDHLYVVKGWLVLHEKEMFSGTPFKVTYYKKMDASSSTETDEAMVLDLPSNTEEPQQPKLPQYLSKIALTDAEFPPPYQPHVVASYFSLDEFVVLTPAGVEYLEGESKLRILASAACVAINNTNCPFPMMVQYHHWSQNYFYGIAEASGVRTSFQMVVLQRPSPILPTHLSELLDMFKSKIGPNLLTPVGTSTHFFYKINCWPTHVNYDSFPPELYDLIKASKNETNKADSDADCEKSNSHWGKFMSHTAFIPFGSLDDPFLSMELVAAWPYLTEDVVVDSPSYSNLEPEHAQEWYFSLIPDNKAEFRLAELINGIWRLKHDRRTAEQILGKPIDAQTESQNFSSALDKMTKNQMQVYKEEVANMVPVVPVALPKGMKEVLAKRRRAFYRDDPNSYEDLAPLGRGHMDLVMDFLFPDAKSKSGYPYPASVGWQDNFTKLKDEHTNALAETLMGVKSAPVGSLVWRMAIIVAYLLGYDEDHQQGQGSSSVVAHLWAELVLEFRYRVENSLRICGLEPGSPNIGSCLLNQKLQMLNCCIEKKLSREMKANEKRLDGGLEGGGGGTAAEGSEEEDDEFFDCEDLMTDDEDQDGEKPKMHKPMGRMRRNGKLRLIKNGEPMYIPETQDPAPVTEDVLEEQSKVMIELGDNAQGSELRAKMMSISLLSDMQAFKAANPGCHLEDFVRWYSPRDWVETGEIDKFGNQLGELSPRMNLPGNLWLEVWSTAHPIPCRRQKRLFDDTKEAEKVLHWLETRSLSDISMLLLPCLMHAAAVKVFHEADCLLSNANTPSSTSIAQLLLPSSLSQNVIQFSRCFHYVEQLDKSANDEELLNCKNAVMKSMLQCEKDVSQIRSFKLKFPNENWSELINSNSKNKTGAGSESSELFPSFIKVANGKKSELGGRIYDIFVSTQANEENADDFNNGVDDSQLGDSITSSSSPSSKFGVPFKRVFVLKYNPPTSSSASLLLSSSSNAKSVGSGAASLPHRMGCVIKNDCFTLAGTFSSKTNML